MERDDFLTPDECCNVYEVEISFINSLREHGLISFITIQEESFVPQDQLSELEKMIRLHYDLDINFEGLEAIKHLLERVGEMRKEIHLLRQRLAIYE